MSTPATTLPVATMSDDDLFAAYEQGCQAEVLRHSAGMDMGEIEQLTDQVMHELMRRGLI